MLTEPPAADEKIRCDACPVMCYIKPGAAGACDRYAKERKVSGEEIGKKQLVQQMIANMVAGRDIGKGPSFWTFDMRLSRRFRVREAGNLDLMFEAFNLFNHLNYQSVNNTAACAAVNVFHFVSS